MRMAQLMWRQPGPDARLSGDPAKLGTDAGGELAGGKPPGIGPGRPWSGCLSSEF
jgi:hypothetical protein